MSKSAPHNDPSFLRAVREMPSGELFEGEEADRFSGQLYEYRAAVRNDLRRWFESVEFLARCFHKPYIAPITAQERMSEDEQRFPHPAVREAFRYQQIMNALSDGQEGIELIQRRFLTEDYIRMEEFVRYTAQKVRHFLEEDRFEPAADVFRAAAQNPIMAHLPISGRGLLYSEMHPYVRESFVRLYREQRFDEIPSHYLPLSCMAPAFNPRTQLDSEKFPLRTPEIQRACIRELKDAIQTHAYSFSAMHHAYIDAGFLPPEGVLDDRELIGAVENQLSSAIHMHPLVFEGLLNSFTEAGFAPEVFIKSPLLHDSMVDVLARTVRKSPSLYLQVRERWSESGLYDPELIDNDSRIQQAYMDVLEELMKKHPFIYRRYRYRWSQRGFDLANYHMLDHRYEDRLLGLQTAKETYGEDQINEVFDRRSDEVDQEMAFALDLAEQEETRILTLVSVQDRNALTTFLGRYPQMERYMPCYALDTE